MQIDWRGQEAVDEKAPPSFFVSSQSPDRPLFTPCAERARPLFVIYHTQNKAARRAAPLCARACTGATFDVSFRVHSSSSLPSGGCEYPSMSSFRVRVQWVRRTRTRSRVRVYRPRRTRTRQLKLACCPGGRPASRSSRHLGWKHFCQCVRKTQRWDEGSEIRVEWHEARCHEAPDRGS